jgi:hypothetical protein
LEVIQAYLERYENKHADFLFPHHPWNPRVKVDHRWLQIDKVVDSQNDVNDTVNFKF